MSNGVLVTSSLSLLFQVFSAELEDVGNALVESKVPRDLGYVSQKYPKARDTLSVGSETADNTVWGVPRMSCILSNLPQNTRHSQKVRDRAVFRAHQVPAVWKKVSFASLKPLGGYIHPPQPALYRRN